MNRNITMSLPLFISFIMVVWSSAWYMATVNVLEVMHVSYNELYEKHVEALDKCLDVVIEDFIESGGYYEQERADIKDFGEGHSG